MLDNVHPEPDGDFSQVSRIRVPGGLLIGSLDVFAGGEPVSFLRNLAAHFPDPARNRLVVITGTGHTYQGKARDAARENRGTGRKCGTKSEELKVKSEA